MTMDYFFKCFILYFCIEKKIKKIIGILFSAHVYYSTNKRDEFFPLVRMNIHVYVCVVNGCNCVSELRWLE